MADMTSVSYRVDTGTLYKHIQHPNSSFGG